MSLLNVHFVLFLPVASSLTCSLSRPSASSTSLERSRINPLEWNVWLLGQSDSTYRNSSEGVSEWLEDFTENLEIVKVQAVANISNDSDLKRPFKVASRKPSIYTHFPKDHNCEVCKRTKITRAFCRRRTGEAVLRAEKVW